jgi:hypothetical protein
VEQFEARALSRREARARLNAAPTAE